MQPLQLTLERRAPKYYSELSKGVLTSKVILQQNMCYLSECGWKQILSKLTSDW